jgi:hypothetical protein
MSLFPLSYASQLSNDVQADARFVYGKVVLFCAEVQSIHCRRYQSEHFMRFSNQVTSWKFKELGFNPRQEKDNFFSISGLSKFDALEGNIIRYVLD